LEEWITIARGHHYFINNVYFLDYISEVSINAVIAVIHSITKDYLAQWFVFNYMARCAERCPDNLPILCSDMLTKEIVHKTATAILRWKSHIVGERRIKRLALEVVSGLAAPLFGGWRVDLNSKNIFKLRALLSLIHGVTRFDKSTLSNYLNSVLERIINFGKFPSKNSLVELIASKCGAADEKRKFYCTSFNETTSLSCLRKAAAFMEIVADEYPENHRLVQVSLAKWYLVRAMRFADSDSDSIYDLANVYMAVLCYITGKYWKATDHCSLVARSQSYQCSSSRVVDGQLLPKIDDAIDTVLGLAVLYQYVLSTTSERPKQIQHASVFSTKLFAYYLNIEHMLVAECCLAPKTQERKQHAVREAKFKLSEMLRFYNGIIAASRLLVADLILVKCSYNLSLHDQLQLCGIVASDSCSRQQLVELLTQMPIYQMLKYRQLLMFQEDVDSQFVAVVKTSDFTSLRLYRCKLYERCAQLCQRAVQGMINGQIRPITRLCFFYREFVQWMDKDVVSLIAITVLVDKSKTQSYLLEPALHISELTISLYLLGRCQMNIQSSKWHSEMSPLADTWDLVSEAGKLIASNVGLDHLDHLILKLAERLSVIYITERLS